MNTEVNTEMERNMSNHPLTTLFVDNLTVIDFSYLSAQRGIVGESWIIDLQLTGQLDQQGMIFDFGHIKKQIKQVIEDLFDHRLLVPTASPNLTLHSKTYDSGSTATDEGARPAHSDTPNDQRHHLSFAYRPPTHPLNSPALKIHHSAPASAICQLPITEVTQAEVKPFLLKQVEAILPTNVVQVELMMRHEITNHPIYQYSHGLQHHEGDCQRIAHGHRSRLEVYIDQVRDTAAERAWCQAWETIYIATERHVIQRFSESEAGESVDYITLGYDAAQGRFEITVPTSLVHMMQTDSTVELIAQHIAETIAAEHSGQSVTVKAYEGINKGAIATVG